MRLHPEVKALLDESGLEWEVERGSRHAKLRVQGRLVQVLPGDGGRRRDAARQHKNCMAALRRAVRELKEA